MWLFSSGPVGEPARPAENPVVVSDILAATNAREHRVFPGCLVKKRLSLPERAMVAALRVTEGDYRNWAEIRDWAAGIAAVLPAS